MEKTKKIDVFNKTPRKIKCITNEMDYLGDGTIFREDKLVVGQLYTLIEASMESYGSVVYLKEIPSNMGIQSCMFEELEEYEFEPFFAELLPQLKGKVVGIFGSYAWNQGDWIETWKQRFTDEGIELAAEPVKAYSYPDDDALAACKALGETVAKA